MPSTMPSCWPLMRPAKSWAAGGCPMCSGAILNSRIRRVVYGAADTKAGCCGSVTDLFALPFNHHPAVENGLRAEEAQALLQAFFLRLREERAGKPRWRPPVTK